MPVKKRRIIVGVMGPGEGATRKDIVVAYKLGKLIAKNGWVLLSGGVDIGVMRAVNKGAAEAGGLTVGILPRLESPIAKGVVIPIITDMGSGRNNINILSSDLIIACGISPGTTSEIALALQKRAHKQVIILNGTEESRRFFLSLGKKLVHIARDPEEVVRIAQKLLRLKINRGHQFKS